MFSYINTDSYIAMYNIANYLSYCTAIATALVLRHSVFTRLVNQITHLQEGDVVIRKNVIAASSYVAS